MKLDEKILKQLSELIEEAPQFAPTIVSQANNLGSMTDAHFDHSRFTTWNTRCLNLLSRVEHGKAVHLMEFHKEDNRGDDKGPIKGRTYHSISIEVFYKVAILKALKADIEAGNFFDQELLITADVFGDILEQADYLLTEGYKDAAAVMTGAVLESTLRTLCEKNQISFAARDTINPLNNNLKDVVYNRVVHKQIIAWAELRNSAAHGEFTKYAKDQVVEMVRWVKDFVSTYLKST